MENLARRARKGTRPYRQRSATKIPITGQELRILLALYRGLPLQVHEIARLADVAPQTTRAIMGRLRAKRFITTTYCLRRGSDGRLHKFADNLLTEDGQHLALQLKVFLAALGPDICRRAGWGSFAVTP